MKYENTIRPIDSNLAADTLTITTVNDERQSRLIGNRCYCRSCDEYFMTVASFDRHLHGVRPTCLDPASVGLICNDFGYWRLPETREKRGSTSENRGETAESKVTTNDPDSLTVRQVRAIGITVNQIAAFRDGIGIKRESTLSTEETEVVKQLG